MNHAASRKRLLSSVSCTWKQPFPLLGNKRFLHLETVVPLEGNDRYPLKGTTVSFKGNDRHIIGYFQKPARKEAEAYKVFNCLNRSQMTIPAVTDTFSECLVPYWGISMQPSLWSITSCWTPFTSLPSTTA